VNVLKEKIETKRQSGEAALREWVKDFDTRDTAAMTALGRAAAEDLALHTLSLSTERVGQVIKKAHALFVKSLKSDSPSRTWDRATPKSKSVARVLKLDLDDPVTWYAMHPFRLAKVDDEHRVIVAFPPPAITVGLWWHTDIETVLSWDPRANTVTVLGDPAAQLIHGNIYTDVLNIYTNPFTFFRKWVEARAMWRTKYLDARNGKWSHPVKENPLDLPGALIVGDPREIRWPQQAMPETINCVDCDRQAVMGSIFRSAGVPNIRRGVAA
jgi:hypothetical protein